MTTGGCERIDLEALTDYVAGELAAADAAAIEEHLFSCADCGVRAAAFDRLVRAVGPAARSAEIGGFVTDDILNKLARDGVRVRSFALAPGAVVPCAVWDDDELMVLRLRAEFEGVSEVTLSQRVGGAEVARETGQVSGGQSEILYATPAALIRQLPAVDVQLVLTAQQENVERTIGTYTLVHGGLLHRSGRSGES
jgi:hypothetical protein